jgi:hypothetical protein
MYHLYANPRSKLKCIVAGTTWQQLLILERGGLEGGAVMLSFELGALESFNVLVAQTPRDGRTTAIEIKSEKP